jgi:DUF971 family protein
MEAPSAIQARREQSAFCFTWPSLGERTISFYDLRCACQCAGCVDEHTGQPLLDPQTVSRDISINDAKLIGNYALKISWTDGHDTGLYTWDYLQKLLK